MSNVIEANRKVHATLIKNGHYQQSPHRSPESRLKVAEKLATLQLPHQNKIRHLDAGCGDGFVFECRPANWKSAGIDVTDEMLQECARNHPEVELYNSPVESMPFEDESFDVVTCYSFLDHLQDTRRFYTEVLRVLKPGGTFYFGLSPNRSFLKALLLYPYTPSSLTNTGVDVVVEYKKGFDEGKYYQENFGLDPLTVVECEPGKAQTLGLDPMEEIAKLSEIGATKPRILYEWVVQQNKLDNEAIKTLHEFLPLTSGCFKYFDIQGIKP